MATNYIQPGDVLPLVAPYDVAAGAGMKIGSLFAVAQAAALSGAAVQGATTGVWQLKKTASQAWTVGEKVYWDDTNKECTDTASTHILIGVAVEAVGAGAGETLGKVRLGIVA